MTIFAAAPATGYAESGASAVSWGGNAHTELGTGFKDTYEESPVPVIGLNDITALAAGSEFTLALLSDGTVRAWGDNNFGQLGDGTGGKPFGTWAKGIDTVTVSGLSGVRAIAAANSHALALLENGTVKAWGNNYYGQLGNGIPWDKEKAGENQGVLPKTVPELTNVMAIASGGGSNFALLSNHTLMAWGENPNGQLGIGEIGPETCVNRLPTEVACSSIPRPVVTATGKALKNVLAVSAGPKAAYALLENGHVMSWGANVNGQLGTGSAPLRVNLTPEPVKRASSGEALNGVVAISAGAFDALALLETGQVVGWGAVGKGELGEVERSEECKNVRCVKTARPVVGLEKLKVTAIAAGEGYGLSVSGGKVYSFGTNEHGELGDGSTSSSGTPTAIEGLGAVSAVTAGDAHALALLRSGVEPPSPLVSLEPGIGSLKLLWTLHAEEYRLEPHRRSLEEANEAKARVRLGEQVHSFEFAGLEAQPYVITIKSIGNDHLEKKREIVGTPLL
jgi:alpha-tubulin suppressor-like RCC1 family protein